MAVKSIIICKKAMSSYCIWVLYNPIIFCIHHLLFHVTVKKFTMYCEVVARLSCCTTNLLLPWSLCLKCLYKIIHYLKSYSWKPWSCTSPGILFLEAFWQWIPPYLLTMKFTNLPTHALQHWVPLLRCSMYQVSCLEKHELMLLHWLGYLICLFIFNNQ